MPFRQSDTVSPSCVSKARPIRGNHDLTQSRQDVLNTRTPALRLSSAGHRGGTSSLGETWEESTWEARERPDVWSHGCQSLRGSRSRGSRANPLDRRESPSPQNSASAAPTPSPGRPLPRASATLAPGTGPKCDRLCGSTSKSPGADPPALSEVLARSAACELPSPATCEALGGLGCAHRGVCL